ncbi:cryptochrome, DASH family [Pseudopedobacter saltans DSM 12145]|uniref:Cryptochrome DASH n=1 Tax=Pseudopedobacter saltans (strain ATCC 51119 / DSM 12145 / JCM 21818 / CCUG 39354 / LMG 10337 / NBRC 100064 / NCIMB 13643) TaxID=762903 RepID=F0SE04_PSESL|nr:DASH family cryptochrome [Pseudopedobacter saltans]ADY52930.1 cryptochrome, DASH family [Pseudopedobacter saltans DSM 12145]
MASRTILVWFRNDLRIHDNEILIEATLKSTEIVPVYIFDPRYYTDTSYGTKKTGKLRAQFIIDSVTDLKKSLKALGGDLLVVKGKPEEVLPQLIKEYHVDEVYHHREVASEETDISSAVEDALWKSQVNLKHFIGHTLYHKEDLPFPIKDIPDLFAKFRKKVEREGEIRDPFETPGQISVPDSLASSEVPALEDLGFERSEQLDASIKGGESSGLNRLNEYLWEKDLLKEYKAKRNLLTGFNNNSQLSPWLSLGCISPRKVYWELKRYEHEKGGTDNINLLFNELLFRDFFRFMFKKHSTAYFVDIAQPMSLNAEQQVLFEKWKNGETGIDLVDANMLELKHRGTMAYKGRQTVAAYLISELELPWFYGAAYFEEMLIDYATASNWGNWALFAGIGTPQKEVNPAFNLDKQIKDSDPKGDYIKVWLSELTEFY